MEYNAEKDCYICVNNRMLLAAATRISKSKTGYISTKVRYSCEDFKDCQDKSSCIKGNNSKIPFKECTKSIEISKTFQKT